MMRVPDDFIAAALAAARNSPGPMLGLAMQELQQWRCFEKSAAPEDAPSTPDLSDHGDGVPYAVDSHGEAAAMAAYSVLRVGHLIRAGDWTVPSLIGRVTQAMIDGRLERKASTRVAPAGMDADEARIWLAGFDAAVGDAS